MVLLKKEDKKNTVHEINAKAFGGANFRIFLYFRIYLFNFLAQLIFWKV